MDDDIQFGDVEEKRAEKSLRPDKNAHYAHVSLGAPSDADLPIFVDLDALLDMEDHARSDTRVELGGVMLGGHFEDDEGQPFVVVTDILRARHYESTKGSFKFTHDTWAEIGRQRDAYPAATQMVGWYHTHPDWGVFLSGMDLFICDHFFNKTLDIAYVIDPCRGHRGMFQWNDAQRATAIERKVRPTRGFYAIASRFRQNELAAYAAMLEESAMSAEIRRFSGPAAPSLVQAITPRDQMTMPIILLMMMLQFGLLAVLVWGSIVSPRVDEAKKMAELQTQIAELKTTVEESGSLAIQTDMLDRIMGELKGTEGGTAQRIVEQARKEKAMVAALNGQEAARMDLERKNRLNESEVEKLSQSLTKVRNDLKLERAELAELKDKLKDPLAASTPTWSTVFSSPWAWGGMFLAAFIGAGIALAPGAMKQRHQESGLEPPQDAPHTMDS